MTVIKLNKLKYNLFLFFIAHKKKNKLDNIEQIQI